jgi:hypothetical protein
VKLRDHAKSLGLDVGCSDSGCIWGKPGGLYTNGGCRCDGSAMGYFTSGPEMRKLARVAQHLAAEVERYDLIDRGKTREINLMTEEIRRMRPVVEAAQAWQHGSPRKAQALSALRDAVDAYEKQVKGG